MTMCAVGLLYLIILYVLFWVVIGIVFRKEITSVFDRDPAATNYLEVLLTYSGLHAIVFYRLAHILLKMRVPFFPRWLSQVGRFFTVRRRLGCNTRFTASSNSSGKNGFCSTSAAPRRWAMDSSGKAAESPEMAMIGISRDCRRSSLIVSSPSRLGMNRSTSARSTGVEWYCRMPSNPSAAKTTS